MEVTTIVISKALSNILFTRQDNKLLTYFIGANIRISPIVPDDEVWLYNNVGKLIGIQKEDWIGKYENTRTKKD